MIWQRSSLKPKKKVSGWGDSYRGFFQRQSLPNIKLTISALAERRLANITGADRRNFLQRSLASRPPLRPPRSDYLLCGHLPAGLNLRFKTIAVFVKYKVHTAMLIAWFFKKAAFFLLFGIFRSANGHFFLFAVIGFRTTHLEYLPNQTIVYIINSDPICGCTHYSTWLWSLIKAEFMPIWPVQLFFFISRTSATG